MAALNREGANASPGQRSVSHRRHHDGAPPQASRAGCCRNYLGGAVGVVGSVGGAAGVAGSVGGAAGVAGAEGFGVCSLVKEASTRFLKSPSSSCSTPL